MSSENSIYAVILSQGGLLTTEQMIRACKVLETYGRETAALHFNTEVVGQIEFYLGTSNYTKYSAMVSFWVKCPNCQNWRNFSMIGCKEQASTFFQLLEGFSIWEPEEMESVKLLTKTGCYAACDSYDRNVFLGSNDKIVVRPDTFLIRNTKNWGVSLIIDVDDRLTEVGAEFGYTNRIVQWDPGTKTYVEVKEGK